jgi:competence protein ComEC
MSGLPVALLAFAAGATLLQWQPALPLPATWMGVGAGAGVGWWPLRTRAGPGFRWRSTRATRCVAIALTVFAAGAFGFGYAASRAEARLADALPPEWEGVDVALLGVIDELPQTSERGTRFAFAVARLQPHRNHAPHQH